MPRDK